MSIFTCMVGVVCEHIYMYGGCGMGRGTIHETTEI